MRSLMKDKWCQKLTKERICLDKILNLFLNKQTKTHLWANKDTPFSPWQLLLHSAEENVREQKNDSNRVSRTKENGQKYKRKRVSGAEGKERTLVMGPLRRVRHDSIDRNGLNKRENSSKRESMTIKKKGEKEGDILLSIRVKREGWKVKKKQREWEKIESSGVTNWLHRWEEEYKAGSGMY